jgi:hypothetical protein
VSGDGRGLRRPSGTWSSRRQREYPAEVAGHSSRLIVRSRPTHPDPNSNRGGSEPAGARGRHIHDTRGPADSHDTTSTCCTSIGRRGASWSALSTATPVWRPRGDCNLKRVVKQRRPDGWSLFGAGRLEDPQSTRVGPLQPQLPAVARVTVAVAVRALADHLGTPGPGAGRHRVPHGRSSAL